MFTILTLLRGLSGDNDRAAHAWAHSQRHLCWPAGKLREVEVRFHGVVPFGEIAAVNVDHERSDLIGSAALRACATFAPLQPKAMIGVRPAKSERGDELVSACVVIESQQVGRVRCGGCCCESRSSVQRCEPCTHVHVSLPSVMAVFAVRELTRTDPH
jgi:hypothetical protein